MVSATLMNFEDDTTRLRVKVIISIKARTSNAPIVDVIIHVAHRTPRCTSAYLMLGTFSEPTTCWVVWGEGACVDRKAALPTGVFEWI